MVTELVEVREGWENGRRIEAGGGPQVYRHFENERVCFLRSSFSPSRERTLFAFWILFSSSRQKEWKKRRRLLNEIFLLFRLCFPLSRLFSFSSSQGRRGPRLRSFLPCWSFLFLLSREQKERKRKSTRREVPEMILISTVLLHLHMPR